jgi:hypothetical protein
MDFLQKFIHRLEVAGGMRYLRSAALVLAVLMLAVAYNFRGFKNMNTLEAMDAAQLARNVSEGKGYTTLFIRPLSMYLIKKRNQETKAVPTVGEVADFSQLRTPHPDLANPPVYPVVLAGLMKALPFRYPLPEKTQAFWNLRGNFWRYQPDFLIAVFNQVLLLIAVAMVFFLARRLFDRSVAWLSALLMLGTDLLWRFSVSGLSTMLLLVIFLGLAWCLIVFEEENREPRGGMGRLFLLAAFAGLLTGVGGLTRYAFGWMIVPVAVFVLLISSRRAVLLSLVSLLMFAAVLTPWIIRNLNVSGRAFGTATYTIIEKTGASPDFQLQRTLEADLGDTLLDVFRTKDTLGALRTKVQVNSLKMIQDDLPRLGGTWLAAFFLAGLLVPFRNPATQRLRHFLLGAIAVAFVVQAFGKTQLSEDSPDINTENLLVLFGPLVIAYGVSLFLLILDQVDFPFRELRYVVIALFAVLFSLPLILTLLLPRPVPLTYPPYHPAIIQGIANLMEPEELTMSDMPWAVAWYGQRQSVWLTLSAQTDYFAIDSLQKPIKGLYLTQRTLDRKFHGELLQSAPESTWGALLLDFIVNRQQVPPTFPLRSSMPGLFASGQLFLTDRDRWRKSRE